MLDGPAPDRNEDEAEALSPEEPAPHRRESLRSLLGGGRAAIEATVPILAFVIGWMASGNDVLWASGVAVASALVVLVLGLAQRRKLRGLLLGLLLTTVAAILAVYMGDGRYFFLVRILSNCASIVIWAISIVIRWPFLGIILGAIVGTKTRWRRDPVLLRAYSRASWIWAASYAFRVVVLMAVWDRTSVEVLGVVQALTSYPVLIACIVISGWVLFGSIPKLHPGIRHPQVPDEVAGAEFEEEPVSDDVLDIDQSDAK
ncbi:DUF3159 domain-containing protein [uncultured Agrococcus sp.]|uniref:DUF3159 domain-containing protein n=1 Tax=uncultured Agrococcus sp. TaxID=382258 RepID=UPI0025D2B8E9|nr:DUF3159 domain-containing protein [uncultured Agrococcus sp.]